MSDPYSLSAEAVLFGDLLPGPARPLGAEIDVDGNLIYRHVHRRPALTFPPYLIPDLFFTYAPDILTWRDALDTGTIHRVEGPAALWSNGSKAYYRRGRLHREDGPAKLTVTRRGYVMPMYYLEGQRLSRRRWGVWRDTHDLH